VNTPAEPRCPHPLSEALNHLTGSEVLQIQRHFNVTDLTNAGPVALLVGVVWAYENRHDPTSFKAVADRTVNDLTGFFPPEPVDPEEETARFPGDREGERPGDG
jgi:hypothetical protein